MKRFFRGLTVALIMACILGCSIPLAFAATLGITQQPQSVAVPAGEQAVLSIAAEGKGLSYEWWYAPHNTQVFMRSEDGDGNPSQYSFCMDAAHDGGRVYCIVSDAYHRIWRSKTAAVYMMTPLELVVQPQDTCAPEGEFFTVTVEATGTELTYAWYFANAGSEEFAKSDVKTPVYKMEMNDLRAGRRLYCVITDLFGQTVQTDTVTIYRHVPASLTADEQCAVCEAERLLQEAPAHDPAVYYE